MCSETVIVLIKCRDLSVSESYKHEINRKETIVKRSPKECISSYFLSVRKGLYEVEAYHILGEMCSFVGFSPYVLR
jgi:hypothetical protein